MTRAGSGGKNELLSPGWLGWGDLVSAHRSTPPLGRKMKKASESPTLKGISHSQGCRVARGNFASFPALTSLHKEAIAGISPSRKPLIGESDRRANGVAQ